MNTLGPFLINSHLQNDFQFPVNQIPVPLLVAENGLIECINASGYFLNLAFQARGNVTQEPFSKVCYKVVAGSFGTQILTVSTTTSPNTQVRAINAIYVPPPRQEFQSYFWINVYEEGEIEWYPPLSITPPPGQMHYITGGPSNTGLIINVPDSLTWYGDSRQPICFLAGFDLTIDSSTSSAAGQVVISNLISQVDGSNSLKYQIRSTSASINPGGQLLSIRYPAPISNAGNPSNIVVSVPTLGDANIACCVYYYLD